MRCKAKQEMRSATRTVMKNGRRAMIGFCDCCGTKMSVAGLWDGDAPRTIGGSDDFAAYLLEQYEVAVIPGSGFGADANIRLSYATSLANIQRGVARIAEAVEALN